MHGQKRHQETPQGHSREGFPGPRDCHTESELSQKEKNKYHMWTHMCGVTYLQSGNRDTDTENRRMDTKGGRWGGMRWETGIDIYTLLLLLLLSRVSCVRLCATPWTAAQQAPTPLGFSRQERWSGLPFPAPMHEREKWKWSRSVVSDS